MQVVILAAGRGKRMKTLTENIPKPLLSVFGNNLIEHKLSILPPSIDEVIIVIGYLGKKIKEHFGENFKNKNIHYVHQGQLSGTAPALWEAKELLHDRFMVMMGDDLYSKEDVKACLKYPWAILVKKIDDGGGAGALVTVDKNSHIADITEGAELKKGDLNNTGMYVLGSEIFNYPLVQIPSGEFGLPQTLTKAAKDFEVKVVESTSWHQISTPEDLDRVEKILRGDKKLVL